MTQVKSAVERTDSEIVKTLHPLVKEWFFSRFKEFSITQKYGVPAIWERKNILISAPTGGTKTLTAFLSILNYLVILAEKNELENKVYCVYTSPLKALATDISKNLIEPLEQIEAIAKTKNIKLQKIRVGLRTGDTTAYEKAKMAKTPPHIMITTPESLAIMLTSKKFVDYLQMVEFCIVDEIHALDNKRGTYLSITLERLNEVSKTFPVKIGLSATISPLEEVAKFLVGISEERQVEIAEVPLRKEIDVQVLSAADNLIEDVNIQNDLYSLMDSLIQEHKTTLIFTNTRAATERVVSYLKDKFPTVYGDDNIAAHHGSLSKTHRFNIEERLRDGKLKVVVCSTSLELGIDIGYIDLVIMLGSPKSSARALQRLGRAGHRLHEVAKGRFIVMDREDLVECSVIQKEMIEKKINKIHIPKNALDVLAQQIYGMAIYKPWDVENILSIIKKSYCYHELSKNDFYDIISYLAGEYALEKSSVYGKIWYDSEKKMIGKKGKLARVIYLTNIGTIPEESFVTVKIAGNRGNEQKIGVIDESFLERIKRGDVFVLGGSKYEYGYVRGMNLYVRPALHKNPTIPSWFSEQLPLSFDTANEINRFRLLMREKFEKRKKEEEIVQFIKEYLYVLDGTAKAVYNFYYEQYKFAEIPTSKKLIIEQYKGEKNYLLFSSMYGRRVNDALSRALGYLMGQAGGRDIELGVTDSGFYIAGESLKIEKALKFLNSKNLREVLIEAVEKTDLLARRFRHCATRSLMIIRTYKGYSKTVGKQQMRSHFLMAAVRKVSKNFPILNEARREVLEDVLDIENAKKVLDLIESNQVEIEIKQVRLPSPFTLNLILQGHSDLIKIEDKQQFLKRMHELHMKVIGEN
ncbi:ATP-dependent helicase [Candidatus Pacearchaeota archaeon CG_4_10_14_0_2_um_filter_05_32_18]|nr:MAG: ATP-dependent helicase [Candidatus Pacearchaeota archaeon CG1_02_32_21]PIZ83828.1 MAG: ATP-dependent helicase [Candidatus Pacearchaeota archaeon CG_4_10_14_0_2_um_filter_05_32_18]